MPLSAVCVSTVTGRPRAWSSYTNLPAKDVQNLRTMNSTEELSTYREASQTFYSPTKKTAYFEYDFTDDKPAKKEKKWSFGNLFRRKKKTHDSSSDDDVKKTFDSKKKRKPDTKKKPVTFDHVVITQPQVRSHGMFPSDRTCNREHILSDTSETVSRHANRILDAAPKMQPSFALGDITPRNHPHQLSLDSIHRKSRRDLAKVRAEARRTSLNHSSSDEDSQLSNSSHKFRSDESLAKMREALCSKKSRAARTERYLKRHSKDGENPSNYLRVCKSDAESSFLKLSDDSTRSPSASPSQIKLSYSSTSSQSPSVLGLSTIPPSHVNHSRFRVSNSTSNPSYKPPLSMNDYNSTAKTNFSDQRSISFDANIHRPQTESQVIHAKLELGKPRSRNLTIVDCSQFKQYYNINPPPPPPRDPRRLLSAQYLDTTNQNDTSLNTSPVQMRYNLSKENSAPQIKKPNMNPTFKSSSEDHIPRGSQISLAQRPSSATPESNNRLNSSRPDIRSRSDNYQYLMDKQPRSRRPIFIQNGINKSLSQKDIKDETKIIPDNKGSTAFLDQLKAKKSNRNSRGSCSPQMFSCETSLQTQIFLPSVLPNNNPGDGEQETIETNLDNEVKSNMDIVNQNIKVVEDRETIQRKSTNLEEALNELEAIYNSLKLGDENLLEMAEKREEEVATQKMLESRRALWNSPRGTLSDSGFSYEPFDTIDATRRKRYSRKSLMSDDMAFRKINREDRAATINDPSKISYLLTSPIYSGDQPRLEDKTDPNEPDITLDDVVYRNFKHSKKLNVPEHPPPFGIPLGPITLTANSDYLHAIPDSETVKPSRIPDLVKDDLAYRNLRKDNNKEPALPPASADDLKNNNLNSQLINMYDPPKMDISEIRKNRALRSKSANIGSLISQEVIDRASRRNARDKNVETECKTLTEIADAMEIARQVLREKEIRINENKRASMSDTDAGSLRYTRYPPVGGNHFDSLSNNKKEVVTAKFRSPQRVEQPTVRSTVKEDTPEPVSSFEDCRLRPLFRTTSFEDALTALAIEAKEASDKFTQDLKNLDVEGPSELKLTAPSEVLVDEFYSEPVNSCKKLLEAAVDSHQLIALTADEEQGDPEMMQSVASIVLKTNPRREDAVESEHDYENLSSDVEWKIDLDVKESGNKSPFEEYKNQLVTTFKELNIEGDGEAVIGEAAVEEPDYCNVKGWTDDSSEKSPGETCVDVVESVACNEISECAYVQPSNVSCSESCPGEASCDSDDESSGFHSQTSFPEHASVSSNDNRSRKVPTSRLGLSETLKSPKLVLETSRRSRGEGNPSGGNTGHIPDCLKSPGAWHNNLATIAIACSYGIACYHQLASLDLFALMGIIFAVLTFIAALFI